MGWNHQLDGIPEADVLVASFFCLQTFDHGLHVVYFFSYAGYDDNVQWMLQPFATTKNGVFGSHRPPQTWDVTPWAVTQILV